MGADQDTVQSAVVDILTVVSALMNGAFNALVCFRIHFQFLLFLMIGLVWLNFSVTYPLFLIDILLRNYYNICGKYEDGIPFLQRKENLP